MPKATIAGELPRTAYITLWFPKPSETFIAREVADLARLGLPVTVFTLYGPWRGSVSPSLVPPCVRVERIGTRHLGRVAASFLWWARRDARTTCRLLRHVAGRRWRSVESMAENLWALAAGFDLAKSCRERGTDIIHATWAGGPATAAWVAAALTSLPYSMAGRAGDIYPPDGALEEKVAGAAFVRVEAVANVAYLAGLVPAASAKVHAIYNGVTWVPRHVAPVVMQAPYRLLAVGRFVSKKGFDVLLRACADLAGRGVDVQLTLAGDGRERRRLVRLAAELGLAGRVTFPGFVPFDQVPMLYQAADLLVMPCLVDRSGDRDGIPTVIMEALAHRVPVVATDVAGIGEVIEDGVTGRLVAPGDVKALADAVAFMVGDRARALSTAEAGRQRVLTMFDCDTNARCVADLLTAACRAAI